jgi:hypothetical protein
MALYLFRGFLAARGTRSGSRHSPNLEKLGCKQGILYTRFHTTALCSPTRLFESRESLPIAHAANLIRDFGVKGVLLERRD